MKAYVRRVGFVAAPLALVIACGGSAPEPKSPAERTQDSGGAGGNAYQPGYPPPPPPPSNTTPQQALPSQPGQPPDFAQPPGRDASAWVEFQGAKGTFDATTSDCAVACKALASIDRATAHVCAIVPEADHCTTAKETLKGARRKVRAECTVCPAGPSTDPDAPIPSVPTAS